MVNDGPFTRWMAVASMCLLSPCSWGTDCDLDGVEDLLAIAAGEAADCNANGVPDDCDLQPINFGFESAQRLERAGGFWSPVAADLDSDGDRDLAAGITILSDFFREGTGIPDPGPFACGPDPTPDGLICESYGLCAE